MQLEGCGAAELGATWLHGLKGHPVYQLALDRGLMDGAEKHRARAQFSQLPAHAAACMAARWHDVFLIVECGSPEKERSGPLIKSFVHLGRILHLQGGSGALASTCAKPRRSR
jgi:hypothetical protein